MNKFNQFLIISAITIGLVACAEKKPETSTTATTEKVETANEEDFTIDEKTDDAPESESGIIDGINAKQIFKQSCAVCHGVDGKLGANGSKDLSQSILTIEEKVNMITKGKGVMVAFESILSAEEIKAVAKYTEQLK